MKLSIAARRGDFHALHEEGYFLLPTAWDVASAKRIEAMGYAGIATSNTSLAWALGRDDGRVTRDEVLTHLRQLVDATETAVNADFESGFATNTAGLMANVSLAIDTGIAALSIKDREGTGLLDRANVVARIHAARNAIDNSGADVLLVGRAEGLLTGCANLDDTIRCLVDYAGAGADVLSVAGLCEPAAIRAVVEAVGPKPLDVQLMKPSLRAIELGELGVRRISVGDAFAEATRACLERVAQQFIDLGDLSAESFAVA